MSNPRYKTMYLIFIFTIIITIVAKELVLRYSLNIQDTDAQTINLAGRQRMLSQRISKHLLFLDNDDYGLKGKYTEENLLKLVDEFENANNVLNANNELKYNQPEIKALFESVTPLVDSISGSTKSAISPTANDSLALQSAIESVAALEPSFLNQMETIVAEYQGIAESNLATTKRIGLILSIISIAVLLAEFLLIIMPLFNKLFRQNESLELANRKLSDFAHIASHNLRAPVSNLNSLLYFHKESKDEEDKRNLINKIEITVDNLNETMDTLIDVLKTQSDTRHPTKIITFQDVLEKTKETISAQLLESNAEVICDFAMVPSILYNPIYLESIVLNLLTNSIKYKSAERSPNIVIRTVRKNGKIQLLVQDNGLGINLERNGDKLFGLNKTFHKHADAKGVGLFMTRNQVESMGGTITAKSKVGEGSTFTVTF